MTRRSGKNRLYTEHLVCWPGDMKLTPIGLINGTYRLFMEVVIVTLGCPVGGKARQNEFDFEMNMIKEHFSLMGFEYSLTHMGVVLKLDELNLRGKNTYLIVW